MSARFVNVDRRTPLLLPCDMREWVQEDDMVHLVIEAVEQLDLEVKDLLEQAEAADRAEGEEGRRLPEQIAQREALKTNLEPAVGGRLIIPAAACLYCIFNHASSESISLGN